MVFLKTQSFAQQFNRKGFMVLNWRKCHEKYHIFWLDVVIGLVIHRTKKSIVRGSLRTGHSSDEANSSDEDFRTMRRRCIIFVETLYGPNIQTPRR